MSKKRRLMVRIVAGFICLIMVIGMIVPYVSAASTDTNDVQDMLTEMFQQNQENNSEQENVEDINKPTEPLPIGFDYVFENGNWVVRKTEGNNDTAFILESVPELFDQPTVTFFVGNLETHKVQAIEVNFDESYITSVALDDGYYVVFSNNYAWTETEGNKYAINNNEYKYIYIGEPTETDIYGINFETENEMFSIELGVADENMVEIPYGEVLEVKQEMLKYPDDADLEKVEENLQGTNPTKKPSQKQEDVVEEKETGILGSIINGLWRMLKGSLIPLVILIVCGSGYFIIKKKKEKELLSQTENDKYDDARLE